MVETRVAPRYRVSKPAEIEYGGDKAPCTIRDLSETGAALDVSSFVGQVPAAFTLIIPEDKLKLPCRVVWRTPFKIGVTFDWN
jgi:PilZ domain-containing protein